MYYLDIEQQRLKLFIYLFTQLEDVTTVWKTDGTLAIARG